MFSCEFCENCKNTFFAEHHRMTASDYNSIKSSGWGIGKWNCNFWYRNQGVAIWARSVNYQKSQSRQKNRFNSFFGSSLDHSLVRLLVIYTRVDCKKIRTSVANLPQVRNIWIFCILTKRHIQSPVKHLRWCVLRNKLMGFSHFTKTLNLLMLHSIPNTLTKWHQSSYRLVINNQWSVEFNVFILFFMSFSFKLFLSNVYF